MLRLTHALLTTAVLLHLATCSATAEQTAPAANDIIAQLNGDAPTAQLNAWFDANARGRAVTWSAPVFNVHEFLGTMVVSARVTDRGMFGCIIPQRLKEAASKLTKGTEILCAGRIDSFESMHPMSIVNIEAEDVVVGAEKIAAWRKAQGIEPAK